jgi:prolyl-tRNA synthetase
MLPRMEDVIEVSCPWCGESQELWVDPQTTGQMVQDCDVCCRPWQVYVSRDEDGRLQVHLERS